MQYGDEILNLTIQSINQISLYRFPGKEAIHNIRLA